MLNETQLLQLCQALNLTERARSVIEQVRSSPPARRVRSAGGNVSVRYPSQKMACVIQAESHKNELAFVYELEYDPQVLEYYDQPPQIKLQYTAKSGRAVAFWHTPDFFVIRTDWVAWVECKPEEALISLADQMPHRYTRTDQGQWHCPPGERYAAQYGLSYRVWSSASIDWVFQRNIHFLEDYLRDNHPAVGSTARAEILGLTANEPSITLQALLDRVEQANSDDIYALIAAQQIYVDLYGEPLAEPDCVHVFSNAATAQAYIVLPRTYASPEPDSPLWTEVAIGAPINWDGKLWLVINVGETKITLSAEDGTLIELPHHAFEELVRRGKLAGLMSEGPTTLSEKAREILIRASLEDKREANCRYYEAIEPMLNGHIPTDSPMSERTLYYWQQKYREAQRLYGYGYLGLLPAHAQKGNRTKKLPEETFTLMAEFIENNYETLKQKNMRTVYGQFVEACEAKHMIASSYKTFAQAVKQRPRYQQVKKRQGKRAAEQYRPFYWELSQTTPRHGDRPFEIIHIDHTELDIELIHSQTGHNLGRPWATFLMDAFSRRLLALYLAYDPPSYRSCMMIVRECVRRHGRLPQILVVDGGKEFHSTYLETLTARYQIIKKTRPPAKARFGSVCERLFGTANTTFVHNLIGNTQITRNVRQVTRAISPQTQAGWTLGRLYDRLCEWAYEVYDTIEHPALGQSPHDAFVAGLSQSGHRLQRLISYDDDWVMATLPTTPKGTATVQPNLGVKINSIYYWSERFRDPGIEKTEIPIRYDPFNVGLAYAFVHSKEGGGQWVQCLSQYYSTFANRSEREIKLASAELRRQNQCHGRQFKLSAKILANFLNSVEAEEVLAMQRLHDAEAQTASVTLQQAFQLPPANAAPDPSHSDQPGPDPADLEIYGDF